MTKARIHKVGDWWHLKHPFALEQYATFEQARKHCSYLLRTQGFG